MAAKESPGYRMTPLVLASAAPPETESAISKWQLLSLNPAQQVERKDGGNSSLCLVLLPHKSRRQEYPREKEKPGQPRD